MNWACISFDAMSIFLNIKQLISKAVHKEILSQILSFTHKSQLILHHFVKDCLSYVGPFHTVSNASAGAVRWPRGGLGVVWGCAGVAWGYPGVAWRVAWGLVGAVLGWPGGGLGRFYYPGTIRESMKYYPGFLGRLAGAGWG